MEKILLSLPHELALRLRAAFPARQRSSIITRLIEKELKKREEALYQCACQVEKDQTLHQEMDAWKVTLQDGLDSNESW